MKITYLLVAMSVCFTLNCCRSASDHQDQTREEHNHEGEEELELSQKQMETVGITLGNIEDREMTSSLTAHGELAIDPQDEATVSPLVPGIVKSLRVRVGQQVVKGQTIAVIETNELLRPQQEYLEAEAEEQGAEAEYQRQSLLAQNGAGVRKNLENAKRNLEMARLRKQGVANLLRSYGINPISVKTAATTSIAVKSPIGGTVTRVERMTGDFADIQTPLAVIANTSAIYCNLNVFEKDITNIQPGQPVTMKLTNNPDMTFRGTVTSINPVLDPVTKAITARVSLEDAAHLNLMPGMAVTASIHSNSRSTPSLPEGAVVSSGNRNYIFVLEDRHEENGEIMYHFDKVEVVCGERSMGYVAVTPLTELDSQAQVVTANAFYLNSLASDHGEHSH